jgi:hypothetical protein
VFTRPELVLEPGLAQLAATGLLLASTIGISFSLQARFAARRWLDLALRLALAGAALVVLFHPERQVAWLFCVPIGLFVAYWMLKADRSVAVAQPR